MAGITNLQTDLLRSFVSVVELGGHSRAGEALGRSQPAISLQIRRLEELVGRPLLEQSGRSIVPTTDGNVLLSYAREMIRLNDEAVHYFHRHRVEGVLRIGLPTDYAMAFLQGALARYIAAHDEVQVEVTCELSRDLMRRLKADELDIVVAVMPEERAPYLSRAWVEKPVWVAAEGYVPDPERPVPLVCHSEGCEYRARMVRALESVGRRWRFAWSGPGVSALQNAVLSGMGASALTRPTLLPGMRPLLPEEGFPELDPIHVGLFYKHPRQSPAGLALISDLVARLDSVGAARPPG